MSTADGKSSKLYGEHVGTGNLIGREAIGVFTLAAGLTLTRQYRRILKLDPGGAGRTIVLPAEAGADGLSFEIVNTADAAEDLTVNNDAAGLIVTISQNEKATVVCDGTTWYHTGITTIALA